MRPAPKIILFGLIFSLTISIGGLSPIASASAGDDHGLPVPGGFCPVGQTWPGYDPEMIEPGTITGGGETFYTLFDPQDGCDCPLGFEITTIDFFMAYPDDSPVPITITVSMGLKEAVPDPSGQLPWALSRSLLPSCKKIRNGFGISKSSSRITGRATSTR